MPRTGEHAPRTGVYRCTSCEQEVEFEQGDPLPPCPYEEEPCEWEFTG
jgi:hypothetical protein